MNECYASRTSEKKLIFGAISLSKTEYWKSLRAVLRKIRKTAKTRISRTLLVRLVGWVRVYKK